MTLVIITGEIDLSVASMVGPEQRPGRPCCTPTPGCRSRVAGLIALLVGASCGAFNGFLVAYVGLPSLAVTIGTLALYRGIASGCSAPRPSPTSRRSGPTWPSSGSSRATSYPMILIPFVVLAVALRAAAALLAVRPRGLRDRAQRRGGALHRRQRRPHQVPAVRDGRRWSRRFAGIYYTLRFGSARGDNATGLELQVIAAVLLGGVSIFGGRGALHGVIAGVLLIGVISSAHAPRELHGQRHQHRHRRCSWCSR